MTLKQWHYLEEAPVNELLGKQIQGISERTFDDTDDDYTIIDFTDGTTVMVVSNYGMWTGKSYDEYPKVAVSFFWVPMGYQ